MKRMKICKEEEKRNKSTVPAKAEQNRKGFKEEMEFINSF